MTIVPDPLVDYLASASTGDGKDHGSGGIEAATSAISTGRIGA